MQRLRLDPQHVYEGEAAVSSAGHVVPHGSGVVFPCAMRRIGATDNNNSHQHKSSTHTSSAPSSHSDLNELQLETVDGMLEEDDRADDRVSVVTPSVTESVARPSSVLEPAPLKPPVEYRGVFHYGARVDGTLKHLASDETHVPLPCSQPADSASVNNDTFASDIGDLAAVEEDWEDEFSSVMEGRSENVQAILRELEKITPTDGVLAVGRRMSQSSDSTCRQSSGVTTPRNESVTPRRRTLRSPKPQQQPSVQIDPATYCCVALSVLHSLERPFSKRTLEAALVNDNCRRFFWEDQHRLPQQVLVKDEQRNLFQFSSEAGKIITGVLRNTPYEQALSNANNTDDPLRSLSHQGSGTGDDSPVSDYHKTTLHALSAFYFDELIAVGEEIGAALIRDAIPNCTACALIRSEAASALEVWKHNVNRPHFLLQLHSYLIRDDADMGVRLALRNAFDPAGLAELLDLTTEGVLSRAPSECTFDAANASPNKSERMETLGVELGWAMTQHPDPANQRLGLQMLREVVTHLQLTVGSDDDTDEAKADTGFVGRQHLSTMHALWGMASLLGFSLNYGGAMEALEAAVALEKHIPPWPARSRRTAGEAPASNSRTNTPREAGKHTSGKFVEQKALLAFCICELAQTTFMFHISQTRNVVQPEVRTTTTREHRLSLATTPSKVLPQAVGALRPCREGTLTTDNEGLMGVISLVHMAVDRFVTTDGVPTAWERLCNAVTTLLRKLNRTTVLMPLALHHLVFVQFAIASVSSIGFELGLRSPQLTDSRISMLKDMRTVSQRIVGVAVQYRGIRNEVTVSLCALLDAVTRVGWRFREEDGIRHIHNIVEDAISATEKLPTSHYLAFSAMLDRLVRLAGCTPIALIVCDAALSVIIFGEDDSRNNTSTFLRTLSTVDCRTETDAEYLRLAARLLRAHPVASWQYLSLPTSPNIWASSALAYTPLFLKGLMRTAPETARTASLVSTTIRRARLWLDSFQHGIKDGEVFARKPFLRDLLLAKREAAQLLLATALKTQHNICALTAQNSRAIACCLELEQLLMEPPEETTSNGTETHAADGRTAVDDTLTEVHVELLRARLAMCGSLVALRQFPEANKSLCEFISQLDEVFVDQPNTNPDPSDEAAVWNRRRRRVLKEELASVAYELLGKVAESLDDGFSAKELYRESLHAGLVGQRSEAAIGELDAKRHSVRGTKWIRDSAEKRCMVCKGEFNMLWRRRHHCRSCGSLICHNCSRWTQSSVRVCLPCEAQSQSSLSGPTIKYVD